MDVHQKRPRDWERRVSDALARSGIRPLTLEPAPECAVEWSVGATYREVTRRRLDLVRFEIGYALDESRAHPWWIYTMVRDTWPDVETPGAARDRWIAEMLPLDAKDWLAMWSIEIGDPSETRSPEHHRRVQSRREEQIELLETTIEIDGVIHTAREMRVPDHRAVIADVPSLGVAVQVFLRRDDRQPIALRSLTIEHPV